jgi:hypothetical protein
MRCSGCIQSQTARSLPLGHCFYLSTSTSRTGKIIMKTRTLSAYKQRGFSLLTGFILAIIMFGTLAFFLAGQGINSGFGSSYSNTSKASGLLASAGYINTGFDAVTLGGQDKTLVTFDTQPTTGVFNPTAGGAALQSLDPTLFVSTSTQATSAGPASGVRGYWIYRSTDITLNGVGVLANADYTMVASGLKQAVCAQINMALHGTATIPSAGTTEVLLVGTAPPMNDYSTNKTSTASVTITAAAAWAWSNGCYSTTDGTPAYVYIHTLLAQ